MRHNKGFSMIEILVALVILAIGLLGMATLMINSLQTSQSASWRSAATLAAYDLAERIRSNIDNSEPPNPPNYEVKPIKAASAVSKSLCSANCSPQQLADSDLKAWAVALDKSIPGAKVFIKRDQVPSTTNYLYCIGLFWEDSSGKKIEEATPQACGTGVSEKNWSSYEVKVLQ